MKTRWHILVVYDEEVMCESLAALLREDGYGVDTAASGRGALEKARQKDYAIYFVDLKMPGGMDGIETMMQIRRLHPEASIILITAYATMDPAITAMKKGPGVYRQTCNPKKSPPREPDSQVRTCSARTRLRRSGASILGA
jgi:DNA-binding NtrC family response regulator